LECDHVTCTWQVTMTSVSTTFTYWLVLSNCFSENFQSLWFQSTYSTSSSLSAVR